MWRIGVTRADIWFALLVACAPGVAALCLLFLAGAVSIMALAGGAALVLLAGVFVAFAIARDGAGLRAKVMTLGIDEAEPSDYARRTPHGAATARLLEEARRRIVRAQRGLESRAVDAEQIIDTLPEPLLILDSRRRILHGNLAAEDLMGPNLSGRSLAEVVRSPDVLEGSELALLTRRALDVDFEMTGPVQRQMRARMAPMRQRGSGGEAVVIILQDLTAIRLAEQMRVDFVANVSHELRTPLASLSGFIETMRGPAKDDPAAAQRFLAIMQEQTDRMGRLVQDLLSLSRIELDEHTAPAGRVNFGDAVGSVVRLLAPLAEEKGVRLVEDVAGDVPDLVGDPDQIEQVLRNLVENAVKYGGDGGEVRISVSRRDRSILLQVQDKGEGIDREHLPRLTERFYRVEPARSRKAGGTGLGLAIVKHIANRHRARLSVDSERGKGSVFSVEFPLGREPIGQSDGGDHRG